MADTSTAVVTRDESARTPAVITTPDEYQTAMSKWGKHDYHVLTPAVTFSGLPPQHGMVAALVQINPNPDAGDVYQDRLFCKDGEVAIAKLGLSKIAQAAGMTIKTERTDPRAFPNYWEVRATARFIGLDGTPQEVDATCEYDLRDGSPRVQKMHEDAKRNGRTADKQLMGARQNGLRACEARAINAAIRQFGIKQKYTIDELRKPFVTLRVTYQPDMSDPEVRRLVTARSLEGTAALYGTTRQLAAAEPLDVIGDVEPGHTSAPKSVGVGSTVPAPETPAYPEGYGPIQSLRSEEKKRRDGSGTFLKWTVVDHAGVEHTTVKGAIGQQLEKLHAAKTPVQIISEDDGYGLAILEVTPYVAQSGGLPPVGDL